jgi:hydrogenase expression/formation protein HypE
VRLRVDERNIPVSPEVASVCELLGLDPLQMACEGRFIVFVPAAQAQSALAVLRGHEASAGAGIIGTVVTDGEARGSVELQTSLGVLRALDLPAGAQLPRIC